MAAAADTSTAYVEKDWSIKPLSEAIASSFPATLEKMYGLAFVDDKQLQRVLDVIKANGAQWEQAAGAKESGSFWSMCKLEGKQIKYIKQSLPSEGPEGKITYFYFQGGERVWVLYNHTQTDKPSDAGGTPTTHPLIGQGSSNKVKLMLQLYPTVKWFAQKIASDQKNDRHALLASANEGMICEHLRNTVKVTRGILPGVAEFVCRGKKQVEKANPPRQVQKMSQIVPLCDGEFTLASWKELKISQQTQIVDDLLVGLNTLKDSSVVHVDLQAQNILFTLDSDGAAHGFISDFGVSYLLPKQELFQPCPYTLTSPEYAKDFYEYLDKKINFYDDMYVLTKQHAEKLNVWQMGLLLWGLWEIDFEGEQGTAREFETALIAPVRAAEDGEQRNEAILDMLEDIAYLSESDLFPATHAAPDKGTRAYLVWKLLRPNPQERFSEQEALLYFRTLGGGVSGH